MQFLYQQLFWFFPLGHFALLEDSKILCLFNRLPTFADIELLINIFQVAFDGCD